MKKILFAIALFLMVFVSSPLDLFAANGVISGDGSTLTPYLIEDVDDFKAFRDSVNSGTSYDGLIIKLTANLDLSTISNWESIGKDNTNSFKGTFEGNNKKITGLTMTGSNGIAGLFGYNRGTVQNLTLINSSMVDTNTIDDAGVVAAMNYGSVLNIVSKNAVISFTTKSSGSWHGLGGIIGTNFGTVDYCGNVGGSITSTTNNNGRRIGGVVGESKGGVVRNCYNTADVNAKSHAVGGIVGDNNVNGGSGSKTEVLNCYNMGNISGNSKIGGVTGETTGSAYLKNSYNAGKTTASSNVGSIAGNTTNGTLDHNFGVKGGSENSTSNAVGYGSSTGTSIITKSTENLTTLLNELNSWVDTNNAGGSTYKKWYLDPVNGYPQFIPTVVITFLAGDHGTFADLTTSKSVTTYKGEDWSSSWVPSVTTDSGWIGNGWDNTFPEVVNESKTFTYTYLEDANNNNVPDIYEKKIVFKIVNGTWDGSVATDITVYVPLTDALGNYSETGTGTVTIPTGMVANYGYCYGTWDKEIPATITKDSDEVYTYSFMVDSNHNDIPDVYEKKVIFSIQNGSWDGTNTADIEVIAGLKDSSGKYSLDGTAHIEIPTGMMPFENYYEGAWTPDLPAKFVGTNTERFTFAFELMGQGDGEDPDIHEDVVNPQTNDSSFVTTLIEGIIFTNLLVATVYVNVKKHN